MAARIGETVSHYRILEHLGAGGMGVVFKAQDLRLRRTVALKFLPPELTRDPDAKARFVHEAQSASALQHDNIGVVHDIDQTEDGQFFIVMECYEGETLKAKLARGMLPPDAAVGLAKQIAAGLAAAHAHGLIHRDIKPANILITKSGEAKIIDFGLAKLSGMTLLTRSGSTLGTAAYMSPEQSCSIDVDHRTDIWSLGVVLYEMLAGRRPFVSDYEAALVYSIVNVDPPPLASLQREIPDHVLLCVQRCLSKDPDARPRSMEEVIALLEGRPVTAGANDRPTPPSGRWKRRLAAGGALTVIVMAALAALFFLPREAPPSANPVVGILLFDNQTGDTAAAAWPVFLQWRLFDDFAGRKGLAVLDPVTANDVIDSAIAGGTRWDAIRQLCSAATVTLVIDGVFRRDEAGVQVEARFLRPDLTEAGRTVVRAAGEDQLARAADSIARNVLALAATGLKGGQTFDEGWRAPKVNVLQAVEQFAKGTRCIQGGDAYSYPHLEDALRIDWSYVAPRALVVYRLAARGLADEAAEHLRVLNSLKNLASPYEQKLIEWAGAIVRRDIAGQQEALETILSYTPGDRLMGFHLARLRYLQMDFHGVVEALRPAVRSHWRYSPVYFLIASSTEQLGRVVDARRTLEESLAFAPVYPESYALLAAMCGRMGDSLAAVRYEDRFFQAARNRGDTLANARASMAQWYLERGVDQFAGRLFAAAVAERPGVSSFHEGWGEALLFLGDTAAAVREFRRTIALDPLSAASLYRLGEICELKGERRESLRYTGLYLRVDSAGEHAAEALARVKRLQ